jgi:hypothetical protein
LKYLTTLAALLALTTAHAAEENLAIDGKKFMDLCNTTEQKMLAVCASFTLGVSDTLAVWRALHPNTARVCSRRSSSWSSISRRQGRSVMRFLPGSCSAQTR